MHTDSLGVDDPKEPEGNTIFELFKLLAPDQAAIDALAARYRDGGMGYGHAKQALFEAHMEHFADARKRRDELEANPAMVEEILMQGAERAREEAALTMDLVLSATGLSRRIG